MLWAGILISEIGDVDCVLNIVGGQVARSYPGIPVVCVPSRKTAGIVGWNMESGGWYKF